MTLAQSSQDAVSVHVTTLRRSWSVPGDVGTSTHSQVAIMCRYLIILGDVGESIALHFFGWQGIAVLLLVFVSRLSCLLSVYRVFITLIVLI